MNIQSIKNQTMEPNIQILNPPIMENYEHKKFKEKEDVDATVKLAVAFEELQKDPKRLDEVLGIRRNKVKFKYKAKNINSDMLSPSTDKLRLFDTLTKDIKSVRSTKKRMSTIDQTEQSSAAFGMSPRPPIFVRNSSNLSNRTIETVREKEQFNELW